MHRKQNRSFALQEVQVCATIICPVWHDWMQDVLSLLILKPAAQVWHWVVVTQALQFAMHWSLQLVASALSSYVFKQALQVVCPAQTWQLAIWQSSSQALVLLAAFTSLYPGLQVSQLKAEAQIMQLVTREAEMVQAGSQRVLPVLVAKLVMQVLQVLTELQLLQCLIVQISWIHFPPF